MALNFTTYLKSFLDKENYRLDDFSYWVVKYCSEEFKFNIIHQLVVIINDFSSQLDAHVKAGKARQSLQRKGEKQSSTTALRNNCYNSMETFKSIVVSLSPMEPISVEEETPIQLRAWFIYLMEQFQLLSTLTDLQQDGHERCLIYATNLQTVSDQRQAAIISRIKILTTEKSHLTTLTNTDAEEVHVSLAELQLLVVFRIQHTLAIRATSAVFEECIHYGTDPCAMLADFSIACQLAKRGVHRLHELVERKSNFAEVLSVLSHHSTELDAHFYLQDADVPLKFDKSKDPAQFDEHVKVLIDEYKKFLESRNVESFREEVDAYLHAKNSVDNVPLVQKKSNKKKGQTNQNVDDDNEPDNTWIEKSDLAKTTTLYNEEECDDRGGPQNGEGGPQYEQHVSSQIVDHQPSSQPVQHPAFISSPQHQTVLNLMCDNCLTQQITFQNKEAALLQEIERLKKQVSTLTQQVQDKKVVAPVVDPQITPEETKQEEKSFAWNVNGPLRKSRVNQKSSKFH